MHDDNSTRNAIVDFQQGKYGWSALNTGLAISDAFLVRALAKGSYKLLFKSTDEGIKGTLTIVDNAAKNAISKCEAPKGVVTRTNSQLVQDIGTRAEAWGARRGLSTTGSVEGTLKHGYADRLLTRYQRMFGDRGLSTEVRYINGHRWRPGNGLRGSVRLDVVEGPLNNPTAIFDYKFGNAVLSNSRIDQIRRIGGFGSNVPIIEIKP